eukprot:PhM_4_TR12755/c0_g3_i1/m.70468
MSLPPIPPNGRPGGATSGASHHPQPPAGAPAKKISIAAFQKSLQRLYDMPVKKMVEQQNEINDFVRASISPRRVHKPGDSSSAKETEINEHLYYNSIKRITTTMHSLDEKYSWEKKKLLHEKEATSKGQAVPHQRSHLSQDEIDGLTDRLFTRSMQSKREGRAKLEKQHYGEPARPKTLNSTQRKSACTRLYNDAVDKKHKSIEKLEGKYLWQRKESKKISQDDVAALVSRIAMAKAKN